MGVITMSNYKPQAPADKLWVIGFIALSFFLLFPAIDAYLNLSWTIMLFWVVLCPLIIKVAHTQHYSIRYWAVTVASLVAFVVVPSYLFLFLAFGFGVLAIVELLLGKLNRYAPLVVILITPFVQYVFNIFGFPIRLQLTTWAVEVINVLGMNGTANGNLIELDGADFSVDAACIGLKMVITTFLFTLFFITHFEQKKNRQLKVLPFLLIMLAALVGVVFSNFVRIIALVLFKSMPNTVSHELIGIACMLLVGIVPVYLVVKSVFDNSSMLTIPSLPKNLIKWNRQSRLLLLGALLLAFTVIRVTGSYQVKDIPSDPLFEKLVVPGYDKEVLDNNILKLVDQNSLIYIKPCKGIFRSDHNPLGCWRASGYQITQERPFELGGTELYYGMLTNGSDNMHTLWWYDNGEHVTNDQLEWRWQMIKGADEYRLVNVTAHSKEELMQAASQLMRVDIF